MNNLVNIVNRRFNTESCQGDKLNTNNRIYNNILECVGNTPLVKLNKIPKNHGVACDIIVKCEYMNPGGSIKDRIGVAMVAEAKAVGLVHPNTEFVEPTSGNTGIGVALNAAVLGKKCTIVMAEKNSNEKVNTMRLMGADVLKLKDGITKTAREIKDKNATTVVMLNQFANDVNPRTHYEHTAAEIVAIMDQVDMIVMGIGTGGTISGVGLKLKDKYPGCKVVVAEPEGSTMVKIHGKAHSFLVEGVGGDDLTGLNFDRSIYDHYEMVTDQESFLMSRELAKEGILCGGSSGMAVAAAIKAAKTLNIGAGKKVVVILPDGIRNYMSKFVTDQWMEANLFMNPPEHTMGWWRQPITNLVWKYRCPMLQKEITCEEALGIMNDTNIAVIIDEKHCFVGAISKDSLRSFATNPTKLPDMINEEFNFKDPVMKHLAKDTYTLAVNGKKDNPTIGLLSRMLDITPFVVIVVEEHDSQTGSKQLKPKGVVTADEILDYIYGHRNL